MTKNYYEVLGVEQDADLKTIKSAFRVLAKKYHPDISKAENAEEKFKEIQEAYDVLGNEEKRKQYDQYGHSAFNQMNGASGFNDFENTNYYNGFSKFDVQLIKFSSLKWYLKLLLIVLGLLFSIFIISIAVVGLVIYIIYKVFMAIINYMGGENG